jgi:MFS family permease
MSVNPEAVAPETPAARPPRKLIFWLGLATLVTASSSAGANLLLANQMTRIDEANKVSNLALVTSVSFAVAIVVQPLVGALSDRTRTRLGRRAPWMLAGAAAVAVALFTIGHTGAIPAVMACWICLQLGNNGVSAPASAILPDRVPENNRGAASALIGIGMMVGAALGTIAAGLMAANLPAAYSVFALLVIVGVVAFVFFNPDRTGSAGEPEPFKLGQFLKGFWINPLKHPDFAWAFIARFLFVLSYFAVTTYALYILTDYVGMSLEEANLRIGLVNAGTIAAALVAIPLGGFLSDKTGRRKPFIYAASVFMAAGLAAPLIWPGFWSVFFLACCFGVGFGLYQACDYVLMTLVLPDPAGQAGKDMGVLNVANAIPNALAPAVGGMIVLATGGYTGLFAASIAMAVLAGLALIPIKKVQ